MCLVIREWIMKTFKILIHIMEVPSTVLGLDTDYSEISFPFTSSAFTQTLQ
jgi:hypothetical protein